MTRSGSKLVTLLTILFLAGVATFFAVRQSESSASATPLSMRPDASATLSPCPSYTALSSTIPADMAPPNSQNNANCFAWAEFIALNWTGAASTCSADTSVTASNFGNPTDTSPKVWELYKQDTDVFLPGAGTPSAWCSRSELVPGKFHTLSDHKLLSARSNGGVLPKLLMAFSKDADTNIKLSDFELAGSDGAWLTAQSGNIVLFEIRMNEDEFDYIDQNGLYNAQTQQTFVLKPGINLYDNTNGPTGIGSIELKASWLELDDPKTWPLYKTSKAWVVYPNTQQPKLVTVGLTGLHIIHKTGRSPQFIWATFEHKNNAPSVSDISSANLLPWYAFYNTNCDPTTDHYQCTPNAQIGGATPSNPYFPHNPPDPMNSPIQVVRENPLSSSSTDNIVALNTWAQQLIAQANPNSVFQNYQLVDVLWANNPAPIQAGAAVPLTSGNPQPNPAFEKVANTTLETYLQNTDTCMDCHRYAPIATSQTGIAGAANRRLVALLGEPPNPSAAPSKTRISAAPIRVAGTYASDYSFVFSEAASPSSASLSKVRRLMLK